MPQNVLVLPHSAPRFFVLTGTLDVVAIDGRRERRHGVAILIDAIAAAPLALLGLEIPVGAALRVSQIGDGHGSTQQSEHLVRPVAARKLRRGDANARR